MTPIVSNEGVTLGMYDDNTTPTWALLWAHAIEGTRPKGWSFVHVWHACDERDCYTHLANLALVPEPFASLTDKTGPLTAYLRWHAWTVYGWKPNAEGVPQMPSAFAELEWQYLSPHRDPRGYIQERVLTESNQRLRILRPIMEQQHML